MADKIKDKAVQMVSVTFQLSSVLKEKIGAVAKSISFTRMKRGKVVPEFTPIIVLMLEFAVANETGFRAWLASGKPENGLGVVKIINNAAEIKVESDKKEVVHA